MIRTYLDTNILITASLGKGDDLTATLNILDDANREYASSIFLKLELLPKPVRNKQITSIQFYENYFKNVKYWANVSDELMQLALDEACSLGLSAMDALHLAAAHMVKADEFITIESPTKPIFNSGLIRVRNLDEFKLAK